MSDKVFLAHTGTPQMFDFDPNGSGRYRQGSGDNPHQHGFDFLYEVEKMRASGKYKNNTEIARAMGYSTGEWRAKMTNAKAEKYAYDAARAYHMRYERQMSNTAIAKELGVSEGTVRNMLKNPEKMRDKELESTADVLKDAVKNKTYVDVGEGVERSLGIPRTKMDAALQKLKDEGYVVKPIQVSQINSKSGQKTTVLVLAPEGTTGRELYLNMDKISLINEYHSDDLGLTYGNIEKPVSVSSKRIEINYADKEGYQPKDGVIELRPGVDDISLGGSKYAQVRIAVDDKYYLKGMAIYSNDLPDGVDIRFNTNKPEGTSMDKVFKEMKTVDGEKGSEIDWDNPFGATIKAGGQSHYIDKNGEKKLSAINKVNEEGDWGNWDRTLASQFLSKQDLTLAKRQLNITYLNKLDEYEDIMSQKNPTIRQKMLQSFADDCDASAVELKAAAMPRQATQVLLPLNSIKENEIYAPNFKNGEHVCLVRYPHSGPSEIPDLVVNNKNKEAISIFGKSPKDCVVINPRVANKLSGADFDGDSVVVIPNKGGKTINTQPTLRDPANPLKTLQDFDPKISYPGYEGMKVMKESRKGTEMGMVANLITDMTLKGCNNEELARAIKHSMVVIDAPKHKLDWKRSEKENGIKELKEKYQGGSRGGASTLISRSKSQAHVPERRLYVKTDPETGEKIYDETGNTYTKTWVLKDGTVRTKEISRKTKSTKMAEASDAFSLASDPNNPLPMEKVYATYANQMKSLGNKARLSASKIKAEPVSSTAKTAYANEVKSLDDKLNKALSNAPYERQAQMAANVVLKSKVDSNPNMTEGEKRKKGQQALNSARARVIPGGKKQRIVLTEKEMEAINAGAVNSTKLKSILNNTDMDSLKQITTPTKQTKLTDSKIARAKAMLASGYYTQAEVAEMFDVSPTTLRKYLD
jgi:DNA-binding CsgD family transcriptional regulator